MRHLGEFFQIFKQCSLDDFHKYKMSMGLDDGKKPVAQLCGCHDLHTADRESVLKRIAIAFVVYSNQTGIRLNRGHNIKESHPLSTHAFIENVNNTRYTGGHRKCLKVYIAEGVALICVYE